MKKSDEKMSDFLNRVNGPEKFTSHVDLNFEDLKNYPLEQNECFYLFDLTKNKIIYLRGFDTFLGFDESKISLDSIFNNYHPDDAAIVRNIAKVFALELRDLKIKPFINFVNISYRYKHNRGNYLNILSQAWVYSVDERQKMTSALIKYTDVSFIRSTSIVKWTVDERYFNRNELSKKVYSDGLNLFTTREMDIIREIDRGLTNKLIGESLNISKHTVATHRKNILKKSNCHNSETLLFFCKKNGLL